MAEGEDDAARTGPDPAVDDAVRLVNEESIGSKAPSTPVGRKGHPLIVRPGTNAPRRIDGRRYSAHALDEMQSDGITPTVVESTILHGERRPGPTTEVYYDRDNKLSVVVGRASDTVITVTRGEIKRGR